MNFEVVALSHPGKRRQNNEDNFNLNGFTPDPKALEEGLILSKRYIAPCSFCVCDGMGGEQFGELSSQVGVETFTKYFSNFDKGKLDAYVKEANKKVCEIMIEKKVRSGSTFCALSFNDTGVFASNIGDSKILKISNNEILQLSRDDTNIQSMIEMELIKPEDVKTTRIRPYLTQYLGVFESEMTIEPNTAYSKVDFGDIYMICSDGVTDMLDFDDIKRILLCEKSLKENSKALFERIMNAGAKDNVTFIVIKVI